MNICSLDSLVFSVIVLLVEYLFVKQNTAGGSVGRARCRHQKVVKNPHSVYYYLAVQYMLSTFKNATFLRFYICVMDDILTKNSM